MEFGGMHKVSLIDYPGRICCTVFALGCNLRCPYCHNASLALGEAGQGLVGEEEVLNHLAGRTGLLDGLCVSGGEPLLDSRLPGFLERVRLLGLQVKLDTNGTRPGQLRVLLDAGLVDYVALDFKAPLHKYDCATGTSFPAEAFLQSLGLL
ncbi:MAG TPA: anaerobic ribonucleoside-triphosphate reductase activating protein, partial [Firmicutes bacterium]|nr:anaerobic ribonucleoside-triphosphate reductase activating protein [Bacillota bacterium]